MNAADKETTTRENLYLVPPEDLVIIEDKAHPLYDERIKLPLSETLIESIMRFGNLVPVLVRRNGKVLEVVDGRQRVRAALEANKRIAEDGGDPVRVRYRYVVGDDHKMGSIMVIANALRIEDPPSLKATKIQRYVDTGYSEEELAHIWGCTKQTIKNALLVLQCTPKVQKAIDTKAVTEVAGRELAQMEREKQDAALAELIASGNARGGGAKAAARSIRKTGKAKAKNEKTLKMKPRHFVEGLIAAFEEMGDKPQPKLAIAVANLILGDPQALAAYTALGAAAARVNRDGTLVADEE
jgi:ParB family chromosome partitioning protein